MITKPFDAVVFDLDGTLCEAETGIISSVRAAMDKMGLPIPAGTDLRQVVGPPLRYSFSELLSVPEDRIEEAVILYKKDFEQNGMFLYSVFPGIRPLLKTLRRMGVHVALATSKDIRIAKIVTDTYCLSHYFDVISGENSDAAKLGKPELIRRALPENCARAVMVGDRRFDVEGAKEAGIASIGVLYGSGTRQELETAGADHIAPTVEDLFAILCPGQKKPEGAFLTMEGPDGSGKTTQADRLEKSLRQYGYDVHRTREPGGCPISEQIRGVILDTKNEEMSPICEALLYAAARAQHVDQIIRPKVEAGVVVFSDRFVDSSVAYQGGGRQLGVELIQQINQPAIRGMMPHGTVYLSIDQREAIRRRFSATEPDRLELAGDEFRQRTHEAYEKLIQQDPNRFLVVDATGDRDTIAREVLLKVLRRLENLD